MYRRCRHAVTSAICETLFNAPAKVQGIIMRACLAKLADKWESTAKGIMPESMEYSISRNVWDHCARELRAALRY